MSVVIKPTQFISKSITILVVCLIFLTFNSCSQSDKSVKGLLERYADAFNNAEFQTLADLTCKPDGPKVSLEEIKILFKNSKGGTIKISEVLREEQVEEDEKARLVVLRIEYENMKTKLVYTIIAPCGGQQRVIVYGKRLYWGEYPITNNDEKTRLLNNLAWFYATNKFDVEKAINLANKANELNPNNPNIIDTLAWAYFKAGKYEQAYYTMEKLADNKGNVREECASHWKEIIDNLPQTNLVCNIIKPPNNFKTKEIFVNLEVDVTPNIYISINNSKFKKLDEKGHYTKKYFLQPGKNQITVKATKYLLDKRIKSQTVQGVWNKYRDNGDGTITDLVTGLIWGKEVWYSGDRHAERIAKNLNLGGYSDWRLPTRKELSTLIRGDKIVDKLKNPYFGYSYVYNTVKNRCWWTSEVTKKGNDRYRWLYEGWNKRFVNKRFHGQSGSCFYLKVREVK